MVRISCTTNLSVARMLYIRDYGLATTDER